MFNSNINKDYNKNIDLYFFDEQSFTKYLNDCKNDNDTIYIETNDPSLPGVDPLYINSSIVSMKFKEFNNYCDSQFKDGIITGIISSIIAYGSYKFIKSDLYKNIKCKIKKIFEKKNDKTQK